MPKYVLASNAFMYCLASHHRYNSSGAHVFPFNLFADTDQVRVGFRVRVRVRLTVESAGS